MGWRVLRSTVAAITILSLLASIATAWLWWRSYHTADADFVGWIHQPKDGSTWRRLSVYTCHGGFQFENYLLYTKDKKMIPPVPAKWWRRESFFYNHPPYCEMPCMALPMTADGQYLTEYPWGWPGFSSVPPRLQFFAKRMADQYFLNIWRGMLMPYSMAFAIFATMPVFWLAIRLIAIVRRRDGRRGFDVVGTTRR